MKILIAGDYYNFDYEEACVLALQKMGHEVVRFKFKDYFGNFLGKIEYHLCISIWQGRRLNIDLFDFIIKSNPEITLIWRGTLIRESTLKKILISSNTLLCSYNNDDPFSPYYFSGNLHQRRIWNYFIGTIPYYDINCVFRAHNIKEYQDHGSKNTYLLKPYFIPEYVSKIIKRLPVYDVIFIGHCEPDRLEIINFLLENGVKVKIFGDNWDTHVLKNYEEPINIIRGKDYFQAIADAKICIAFLSKINRDVYTIRSFEIPSVGSLMLSERTDELLSFYKEDKEAVFFTSKEEALKKVKWLLANEDIRAKIGIDGQRRAFKSKYDIESRMLELLQFISITKVSKIQNILSK